MTQVYDRAELIAVVQSNIDVLIDFFKDDKEVELVDLRLQLVDGYYRIWTGDSQFDTDHRGFWGSGTVVIHPHSTDYGYEFTQEDMDESNSILAELIVDEALQDYECFWTEDLCK